MSDKTLGRRSGVREAMSNPWLETWQSESITACLSPLGSLFTCGITTPDADIKLSASSAKDFPAEHAQLASAAPDMCRALLMVEWGDGTGGDKSYKKCPYCVVRQYDDDCGHQHGAPCILDAALTKAGLPDQASRDAARKELGL